MTESTPYKCVNCFLGLTSMQTWKFADVSPLCVSCYDSLCEQKRAKQPESLADCIGANLALPKFYGTQPATLPETLPAGLVIKVAGIEMRLLEAARLIASGCAYDCPECAVKGVGAKDEEILSRSDGAVIPLGWLDWSSVPVQEAKPAAKQFDPSTVRVFIGDIEINSVGDIAFSSGSEDEPVTCRDCGSPATVNGRCVYCAHRCESNGTSRRLTAPQLLARQEAMERMLRVEAREKPRGTKESKSLAAGHPSTWPSQEDEP